MDNINRSAWNNSMYLHQKKNKRLYDIKFKEQNYSVLFRDDEVYLRDIINVNGKSVVQLCCNNGVELMSLYNLGAKKLVGFDLCDEAIKEGRERCEKLNYPIELNQSDIYEINLDDVEKFDVVFLSVGSIRWLKSMGELYYICSKLLKDKGSLYISDIHPLAEFINDDVEFSISPLEITQDYMYKKHRVIGSLDYVGHTNEVLVEMEWYSHTFTEILGELNSYGFMLKMFKERYDDLTGVYGRTSSNAIKVPLSFCMEAVLG